MRMRKFLSYLLVFAMVFGFATNIGVMEAKAEDEIKYCIAGTMNGWSASENELSYVSGNKYCITGLIEAGTCEFKITDGTWDQSWGADGGSNNASFTLEEFGNVVFVFDSETKITTINPVNENDSAKYYITGDMNEWTPGSEDFELFYISDTKYCLISNLEAGDYEFKVSGASWNEGDWGADGVAGGSNINLTVEEGSENTVFVFDNATKKVEINPVYVAPTATPAPTQETTSTEKLEDSTEANTLVLNIKNNVEWEAVYAHAWLEANTSSEQTINLTEWPGAQATKNEKNDGWYTVSLNITDTARTNFGLVANNGSGKQSQDFKTDGLKAGKNEYWIQLEAAEGDGNCLIGGVDKPAGWVDTVAPTVAPATTATPAPEATPTPAPVEVEEPTAKFHFKNSEKWEKVGIYFTTGDSWTEVTGKWPGSAMTLETGSTTWYEYDYYGIEKSFNYIFNNLVDGEGAVQTLNIEKAAPGEYWITLGEKDAEGKFAVNVATKAPADYDGKGIPGKASANWTEAKSKIEEAAKTATDDKAATAEVDMKDSTKVPADVLGAMKDKNIDVSFKMGDLVWTINGKSIKDASKELNIGAVLNATAIDAKKVEKLASTIKCAKAIQLSLAHNGDFGAKLNLKSTLGKDYAGKFAVLYYYNPTADKFEYQQYVKIDAEGCATFAFDHASDYVIAITDDVVAKSVGAKTADTATTAGMVLMMLIASAGVVFVSKKRKMFA